MPRSVKDTIATLNAIFRGRKATKSAIENAVNPISSPKKPASIVPTTTPASRPTPGSAITLDGEYEVVVRVTGFPAYGGFDPTSGPTYSKITLRRGEAVELPLQEMHPGFASSTAAVVGPEGFAASGWVRLTGENQGLMLLGSIGWFAPDGAAFFLQFNIHNTPVAGTIRGDRTKS